MRRMTAGKARILERVTANAETLSLAGLSLDQVHDQAITDPATLQAIIRTTQRILGTAATELQVIGRGIDAVLMEQQT
jgi:hypothetical protein